MTISSDPYRATLLDYVVEFADDEPPKTAETTAISDQHAVDMMKKEYSNLCWKIYRKGSGRAIYEHFPRAN